MSFFTDSQVDLMASKERICAVDLIRMELSDGEIRAAQSGPDFVDAEGVLWRGVRGGVITYDSATFKNTISAPKRTYTFSGFPDNILAASMVDEEAKFRGGKITQYMQFCLPDTKQPVGSPVVIHTGIMDRLRFSVSPGGAARLQLTAETQFAIKNRAAFGFYTDTDQRERYPDDAGLDLVKLLAKGVPVRWPDF